MIDLTTDRERVSFEHEKEEAKLALDVQVLPKYSKEEIKFSKGVMTALKNKINILCDADRDIPARYMYTIEQIERATL